jgi:uncharacterized damage-inducible protein DinB
VWRFGPGGGWSRSGTELCRGSCSIPSTECETKVCGVASDKSAPGQDTELISPPGCKNRSVIEDLADERRQEPPYLLGDRTMIEAWLEFHRVTLLLKCEGLGDAARKARPIPTSKLSLHGLVRHMAEVERGWFQRTLLNDPELPALYRRSSAEDDADLVPLDGAIWEEDLATWQITCSESRSIAASHDLQDTGLRHGEPCSLRWILVHMIEEYARHNGHADLIRELLDGKVGW